jgi:tRNA threonylcarbamoyladenosine biosynthesis protein TsaB
MGLIEGVMRNHGGLQAVGAIAVSLGPGSFTGLRIGVSVAKGLAYGGEIALIGVPTLDALIERTRMQSKVVRPGEKIVALLQARRGEFYVAEEGNTGVRVLSAVKVAEAYSRDGFIMTGDCETLGPDGPRRAVELPVRRCSAESVGIVGERMILEGKRDDIRTLEPRYTLEFLLNPDLTERT